MFLGEVCTALCFCCILHHTERFFMYSIGRRLS
uniref:Uncharacterized protein n=1 Tax=Rhizophora mucronata TaxID=61149 RepID=A0A2P2QUB7_RHIMU